MKIIALEEHWCPRELFDKPGAPGYNSMNVVRNIESLENQEIIFNRISNIGAERIQMMDRLGIMMQVLSISAANMELLPDDDAIHFSKLSNDILAEGVRKYPDRLRGFAAIPTGVPEEAAKELERCIHLGCFVGAIVNGHIKGQYLDDPRFEPLLATAEKLNVPIYIHPTVPPKPVIDTYYRMDDPYAQSVLISGGWGWHIETGTHVLRLIASGTFDKFPKLKIIIGHLGEGLPFFMERLNNATGGKLEKSYPAYLRENVYYTISGFNYPTLFDYVLKQVGADQMMFSTDYPLASAETAINFFNEIDLDDQTREKIAYKNAEQLLRL